MIIKVKQSKGDGIGEVLYCTLQALKEYDSKSSDEEIVFDFSGISFIHPLALLPLASLKHSDPRVRFINTGYINGYLEAIRFPEGIKVANLEEQRQAEARYASKSYVPITAISLNGDKGEEDIRNNTIGAFHRFLKSHVNDPEVFKAVRHIIDELSNNIVEHSAARKGFLMAHVYPSKELLHICILDGGVGIAESYRKSGYPVGDDVTAMTFVKERRTSKNNWHPSERGFGLHTSRKMAQALGGASFLLSGNALLFNGDKIIDLSQHGSSWSGTLCAISIKLSPPPEFRCVEYME